MFFSNDSVYQDSTSLYFVSSLVFKQFQQNRYFVDLSFYKTNLFKITLDGVMACVCVCVCIADIQKAENRTGDEWNDNTISS